MMCNFRLQNETLDLSLTDLEKELQDLKDEEQQLRYELENLKQEEIATVEAIKEQEKETDRLSLEESTYFKEYTRHQRDCIFMNEEYGR